MSLSEQAYHRIRRMIIELVLEPGAVLREDELKTKLGVGRTPIREALQRLAREQFITVVPRQGMFVSGLDVSELSLLYETRAVLEPYAARLAAARGTDEHWADMAQALRAAEDPQAEPATLLSVDRRCHEIMWDAAGNRFLVDTLDTLYAQSDRLWHMYLADVVDMDHAVAEHVAILDALREGAESGAAELLEAHVRSFDEQVRVAVTARLASPLAGG
ncbi:MAG: GntR family transcriptional regulator [Actinomycetia bacterium]|nr:GntR family transcriptional regulator [Actinomycetes bacterium]MCP3909799.1 GntR family transcriptional regulator [Actinomycetes bacterium]MCP4085905.1 GntR family transcriptional regulator [Actinomycetes bacterium]